MHFEFERKELNRIIANVETIINRNYDIIKSPITRSANLKAPENQRNDGGGAIDPSLMGNNTVIEEAKAIPFVTINDLVKKQTGTFNTKGTITSITPIMQAIAKIKWKCTNDRIDANGSPVCANPYNERVFDPPLLRLDGLHTRYILYQCVQCVICVKVSDHVHLKKE